MPVYFYTLVTLIYGQSHRMKRVYVYRHSARGFWGRLRLSYYSFLNFEIFTWGDQPYLVEKSKKIVFPPATNCIPFEEAARAAIATYFRSREATMGKDIYRFDYIRKIVDIHFLDYFAFRTTVNEGADGKSVFFEPTLFRSIFFNRTSPTTPAVIPIALKSFFYLVLEFARSMALSVRSKKMPSTPVLYLRKKVYPDMGIYNGISSRLNSPETKSITGCFTLYSRKNGNYGFEFLNRMEGIEGALWKSLHHSLVAILRDGPYFLKNGIPASYFARYLKDTFRMCAIAKLPSKVICGILVDKPCYVLLSKYKNKDAKIASINESFFFPPSRSFDYNHLDWYYSLNDVDSRMQNRFGGKIGEFRVVEFFRGGKSNSKGLSIALAEKIKQFSYSVTLTPAQVYVETSGFYYWAYPELEKFLVRSLDVAEKMPDTLFIIKGKKGELKLLPPWFGTRCDSLKNVHVIHCDKPRDLEYDHFEDLLEHTDLVVSMCHTSTTIWQAFAANKPALAINDIHPKSILQDHPYLECNLDDLQQFIQHWKNRSKEDLDQDLAGIRTKFNIGHSEGLQQVAADLKKQLAIAP